MSWHTVAQPFCFVKVEGGTDYVRDTFACAALSQWRWGFMDKLTLDTNVLRDWAWVEGISPDKRYDNDKTKHEQLRRHFAALKALRDTGKCEFGITTQFYTDYDETKGDIPAYIQNMIGQYVDIAVPAIFGFPVVFPMVFPNLSELEAIFTTLFPDSQPDHNKYDNNRKDALQLYAHKIAERTFFLTSDKAIIRKQLELAQLWKIEIRTVEAYLKQISGGLV